jgi:hypothetical protein
MHRQPNVAFFITCFFSFSAEFAAADNINQLLGGIKRAGATVRESSVGLEIGFHLRRRTTANTVLASTCKLQNVVWLDLSQTNITNQGLSHLNKLKNLRWLHLENTKIDDSPMSHLIELKKLESLTLQSTAITDNALQSLKQRNQLKTLYVWQTRVTSHGIEELRKAAPDLKMIQGIDLSELAATFPSEKDEPKPKITPDWVPVEQRDNAPAQSENGVNCRVWFENHAQDPVKLYWIRYGAGELKLSGTIKPKAIHKQNSYARNACRIADLQENPLGFFVVKDDGARAIIRPLPR